MHHSRPKTKSVFTSCRKTAPPPICRPASTSRRPLQPLPPGPPAAPPPLQLSAIKPIFVISKDFGQNSFPPHQSPEGHQRGRTESSKRLREARLHRPVEVADELPVVQVPLEDHQFGVGEFLVELGRGRRHLGKVVRVGPEGVSPDLPRPLF